LDKILITGSEGYIGRCLVNQLKSNNKITLLSRKSIINGKQINDLQNISDWKSVLKDVNTVIHLAAYVHKANLSGKKSDKLNFDINYNLTKKIAENAKIAGVKNFIFLSSIGVLGARTRNNKFKNNSEYSPYSKYTYSKMLAEKQLRKMKDTNDMNIIILRTPLIYGKNPKGTLRSLLSIMKLNLPIPFGLLNKNKRSYISINNLVSCILSILNSNKNFSGVFNISDNSDISTYEFVKKIKKYSNSKSFIFPMPIYLLKLTLFIIGKRKWISSAIDSLQIDSSYEFDKLNWKPKLSVDEEIKKIFL
tara:strand:- start:754 stop:1671 length:918 start_codon:yes stop_codon:yes gene_type:complete